MIYFGIKRKGIDNNEIKTIRGKREIIVPYSFDYIMYEYKVELFFCFCDSDAAHCDTTVAMMLVGNKCDLDNIRAVSIEEGKSLAESEGLFFMETSALDSTNVKTAFEMVIREIYNNVSRKVLNSDTYKAELSVNRVSLVNNSTAASKQNQSYFSCCSR